MEPVEQTAAGVWVPTFPSFTAENKLRHIEGQYRGICTSCPDGKITRGATKHVAKMAGIPDDQWDKSLFDVLNFTGSSKGFLHPVLRDSSLYQLELLASVHNLETYILIDHEKCAAYREELSVSPFRDNEAMFHQHRLQEAYWIIKGRLPELKIILVYLSYVGNDLMFSEVPPPALIQFST